ncbi:DUF6401 family natural product biosynthesis protein [Amycolatopsis nigrescens]|uniref:DUF6401 family natural product biosynthesis protein n=1 Tax=Amycolatopsis nigrescens TaxID=381445 RepID=UPI00037B7A9E|nr:DUF6401 family natural product biosynthesis protein [Amycolatopsis nigrescens]
MSWLDLLTDRSARRWLSAVAAELTAGWAALAADPSLHKGFERHLRGAADSVRREEELVLRTSPVSPLVLLASHAHDVRALALRTGWRPPDEPADWTPGEWTGLRLLACYRLAAREPRGPRLPVAPEGVPLPSFALPEALHVHHAGPE